MTTVLLVAVIAGLVIGMLSGLLGIGGGTMIIPVLRLGFGLQTLSATATSLFTIVLTSISGGIGHIRNHTANIKAGVIIGLAGACFSPLGSVVSTHLGNLATMLISAAVFLYIAYTMFKKGLKMPRGTAVGRERAARLAQQAAGEGAEEGKSEPDIRRAKDTLKPAPEAARRGPSGEVATAMAGDMGPDVGQLAFHGKTTMHDVIVAVLIGCAAGFAAGMLGIGGGFIIIPLTCALFGFSMNEASGTSLIAILPLAITGTIAHAAAGQVEFLYGLAISIGTIPGAYLGARLSKRVPERTLRLLFGCVLVIVTIILVLNELGLLG
jgi:uncharacterized membrane protein YfcA